MLIGGHMIKYTNFFVYQGMGIEAYTSGFKFWNVIGGIGMKSKESTNAPPNHHLHHQPQLGAENTQS